jgi:phospholipid/cholesterol/gamma-HCH transport system permease protein
MAEPFRADRFGPAASLRATVEDVGDGFIRAVEEVGGMSRLLARLVASVSRPPWRGALILAQMDFIGVGSTFLVALTGLFTGMVFAKQSLVAFRLFAADSLVGPTVVISLTRELAPVFTALMMTMRAGSAMCTELGTMRVTEQIDALVTLAVDPVKYLVFPRVVAGTVMAPVLCMVFNAAGTWGTYFISVQVEGLSAGTFLEKTRFWVDPPDIFEGLIKSAVFGLLVTLIGCYKGFNASGGAKGVGRATTEAMVITALSIFIADYVLGLLLIGHLGNVREFVH